MRYAHFFGAVASLASIVIADDSFVMCTDNKCEQCPSAVVSSGTDYPSCVIYNSDDAFANQGYEGSVGGVYNVFFNVQEQGLDCATIIKSPASTDILGCGATIAAFKHPACAALSFDKTFMVQTCCGKDCEAAGGVKIRGSGPLGSVRSVDIDGRGGVLLKYANGTVIPPAEVGLPLEKKEIKPVETSILPRNPLTKRDANCAKNSWKGGEVLTKSADNVQIMLNSVDGGTGGATVSVSTERTQTWSLSANIGLTAGDILNLGVSSEFSESISSTKMVQISISPGQVGKLGFTATMSCSNGSGECEAGTVEGEVCWPSNGPDGDVAGTYRVIVES